MTPSPVNVVGAVTEMGGLKESQATFRKHHRDVGNALLNLSGIGTVTGGPVDKDEDRPPYEYQEFPKMLHHADGTTVVVGDKDGEKEQTKNGYRRTPYPRPQVHVGDPQAEKKELLDRNRELTGQISTMTEMMQKMQERMDALEGKK